MLSNILYISRRGVFYFLCTYSIFKIFNWCTPFSEYLQDIEYFRILGRVGLKGEGLTISLVTGVVGRWGSSKFASDSEKE